MRIRIYDDFDSDLDAEYKSIDNDTIVGNGVLSKEDVPIIDVKTETVNKDEVVNNESKNRDVRKEEGNKYNLSNGFSIEIQGATLLDDDEVKNYINNKASNESKTVNRNNNLESNRKNKSVPKNKRIKENKEYIEPVIRGKITVDVRLGDRNGKAISEAKINLYALNGLSPKLVSSKLTNINGIVIFDSLPEGSYRVIEIVNRKYFEKPTYIQWNEVTINKDLREEYIIVVNKIKKYSK
ncbi:MAG: prealbumin-like fold domain-containing protein [Clostridium celatum]|nr:prealbumin-like fold domain-containing protein [Clostridium celatum]MDU4980745.1 prealbumin-like fold domain-containing protein [Clostridium celatum]